MAATGTTRFPIRFDRAYAFLSRALWIPPSDAYVELQGDAVHVRMAWAFRARFPRSSIASVRPVSARPLSRGVHGLWGRWLVNGSGTGLLALELRPAQRGAVLGVPVRLEQLTVSVDDPSGLAAALGRR